LPRHQRRVLHMSRSLQPLPPALRAPVLAPCPWLVRRPPDRASVTETLVFALHLGLSLVECWRRRARWQTFAVPLLAIAGIMGVLALTEGNAGTLFRHRSMTYPLVAVLAAPPLAVFAARALVNASARRQPRLS